MTQPLKILPSHKKFPIDQFAPDELAALGSILDLTLAGGDARIVARSQPARSLMHKIGVMRATLEGRSAAKQTSMTRLAGVATMPEFDMALHKAGAFDTALRVDGQLVEGQGAAVRLADQGPKTVGVKVPGDLYALLSRVKVRYGFGSIKEAMVLAAREGVKTLLSGTSQ